MRGGDGQKMEEGWGRGRERMGEAGWQRMGRVWSEMGRMGGWMEDRMGTVDGEEWDGGKMRLGWVGVEGGSLGG